MLSNTINKILSNSPMGGDSYVLCLSHCWQIFIFPRLSTTTATTAKAVSEAATYRHHCVASFNPFCISKLKKFSIFSFHFLLLLSLLLWLFFGKFFPFLEDIEKNKNQTSFISAGWKWCWWWWWHNRTINTRKTNFFYSEDEKLEIQKKKIEI